MRKVYTLAGLDCPNCAEVIRREVGALPGVEEVSVNLMAQTLTVEGEDPRLLLADIRRIVADHEPGVRVTEKPAHPQSHGHGHEHNCGCNHEHSHEHGCGCGHDHGHNHSHNHGHPDADKKMRLRLAVGCVLFAAGIGLSFCKNLPEAVCMAALIAAYGILGYDVVGSALRNLCKGRVFDENFLMSLSSVGAFCIGERFEAVAVMLFYQIGEYCQSLAVRRSRRSISALMDIRPDSAEALREGQLVTVEPETVAVGEEILIRPGRKIPLDGVILEGRSMLDTRALTGESVPRSAAAGDQVLSGCVNGSGTLRVRVTRGYADSTVARILELVENAAGRKARTEQFITRFARWYTPAVVLLAALIAVIPPLTLGGNWSDWVHRGFVFLVISCPCALVISVPLAFFGGIGAASRQGVLVKGGNYLEALNKVDTVVFDKTGTLTQGVFAVSQILPAPGITEAQVLALGGAAEALSEHPIAKSILVAQDHPADTAKLSDYREIPGYGIRTQWAGKTLLAGSGGLMAQNGVFYIPCDQAGTKVYVALAGEYQGCILISDRVKPDSANTIAKLKKLGVRKILMLTGDEESVAAGLAGDLGLDGYRAGLLPDEKVAALEQITADSRGKVAFVGDGINDAPALARADVGIAMGALGSDAAIEAADVVLMTDEPGKLADAIRIARQTHRIVTQNIVFALALKLLFLALGALGIAGMWEAVFADVGVALLAVCNAMRILKK